ncbi:MAG: hypothetical protein AAF928_14985 [Myxococcota bacterium]
MSLEPQLQLAAAHASRLAEAARIRRGTARSLGRRESKQLKKDLALLAKGVRDGVQHVALMVGYRDGYPARTRTREGLLEAIGEPKRLRSVDAWLEHIAAGAQLLSEAMEELVDAPPPIPPPAGHPDTPGPEKTAGRAVDHLGALVSRLEITIHHYVPLQ